MKVTKIVKTKNPKYPRKVMLSDGTILKVPQQKKWNSFCQKHGCSIVAVQIALQHLGVDLNPNEVYEWCKKHITGYTGSKLTVYGTMLAINNISKSSAAKWYPVTGSDKNKKAAINRIRECLKAGGIVLFEQRSPIHTNVIVGFRKGGVYNATNGVVKKTTVKALYNIALHGYSSASKQRKWFRGSKYGAGYVTVIPDR